MPLKNLQSIKICRKKKRVPQLNEHSHHRHPSALPHLSHFAHLEHLEHFPHLLHPSHHYHKKPSSFLSALCLSTLLTSCMDQSVNPQHHNLPNAPRVGGGCDGCELMYIGMPEEIASSDTSVGWSEAEQKLQVNGTVLKSDGVTPAPNILIYY